MIVTELQIALVLGLTLSLIFSEKFGIIPGGLIVPGYLALSMNSIQSIILIFIMSFIIYITVNFGISKIIIIYGRRRFLASLVCSICLKLLIDICFPELSLQINALTGVGIVLPGLIAHTFYRQGINITAISTLGIAFIVYGTVNVSQFI